MSSWTNIELPPLPDVTFNPGNGSVFWKAASQEPAIAGALLTWAERPELYSVRVQPKEGKLTAKEKAEKRLNYCLWHRLVWGGQSLQSEAFRERLVRDGVHRVKRDPQTGRAELLPIGDVTFRAAYRELASSYLLPTRAGEFGLARNREEADAHPAELEHRADEMMKAGLQLARGVRAFVANPRSVTLANWDEETVDAAMHLLATEKLKAWELAIRLGWAAEKDGARRCESKVRALLHDLREAGVPVLSDGEGSWIPMGPWGIGQATAYVKGLGGRVEATRRRAVRQRQVAALCFPQTPEEHAARERFRSRPRRAV